MICGVHADGAVVHFDEAILGVVSILMYSVIHQVARGVARVAAHAAENVPSVPAFPSPGFKPQSLILSK